MPKLTLTTLLASVLLASAAPRAGAAESATRTALKPFNVTIRVFDPAKVADTGQLYVLPHDSPDAEHAAASTMANAVSFTKKTEAGKPLPVTFTCVEVEAR